MIIDFDSPFDVEIPDALIEAMDRAYLAGIGRQLLRELRRFKGRTQSMIGDIRELSRQESLGPRYCEAYQQMESVVGSLFDQLEIAAQNRKEFFTYDNALELVSAPSLEEIHFSDRWIEAARQVISEINAAELKMVSQLKKAKTALIRGASDGIFNWKYDGTVGIALILRTHPSRHFYGRYDDQFEELAIPLDWYGYVPTSVDVPSWNPFIDAENHPLKTVHMEYLAHCIVDRMDFPWQLLPLLKEVEVKLDFSDHETLWNSEGVTCRSFLECL